MPKKRLSSPLLQKVSRLLKVKVPIFIARMRKSINIRRLISLKKSRKMKKFMLLNHYKYGNYIQEYQFSPSNSPFFQYYNYGKPIKNRRYGDLYSIFLFGRCLGMIFKAEREYRGCPMELKALPSGENRTVSREVSATSDLRSEDDNCDSIDERAENFIESFYQEMRLQRQESLLQFNALMQDIDS